MRITKVTTKVGDGGKTKLGDGTEVSKSDLRIHCIGEVDELNSFIGLAKVSTKCDADRNALEAIQNELFNLGGELSMPNSKIVVLHSDSISNIEKEIETINQKLSPLKEFVIPGRNEFSARLHIARSVCRRVERKVVELIEKETGSKLWIKYLNRLSDYLFVLARYHNQKDGVIESQWRKD